jgi:ABC-type antimicrobial peptide transport system permease subunit
MKKKKLNRKELYDILIISAIIGVVLSFISPHIESFWLYLLISALTGLVIGLIGGLLLRWRRKRKEKKE